MVMTDWVSIEERFVTLIFMALLLTCQTDDML